MEYIINVDPDAFDDILRCARFISRKVSPASAARWHAGILTKIHTLENDPERYPLADEAATLGLELRLLVFGRKRHVYRILYTIDGQTVNIHRVRHAAQDTLGSEGV